MLLLLAVAVAVAVATLNLATYVAAFADPYPNYTLHGSVNMAMV